MRHGRKIHKLSKAADQRRALLRSLASQLFLHGEITTTMARAKALKPFAESIITFAKKGDLAARREAKKDIYDIETEKFIDVETGELFEVQPEGKKLPKQTVLRQLFSVIGKKSSDEVIEKLHQMGLDLQPNPEGIDEMELI